MKSAREGIPSWLKAGLEATYMGFDEIGGLQIHITGPDSHLTVRTKVIDGKDLKELSPEIGELEWEETSLAKWQATLYGGYFIDVTRDTKTQRIFDEPTEYIGIENAHHEFKSYPCLKFRVLGEIDCVCTEMKKHAILFGRSGKCTTCWGVFSSLRKCPDCGGKGICPRCSGKGRRSTEDFHWFEEKTGILLKHERFIEGKLVNRELLRRLEPNVLPSVD